MALVWARRSTSRSQHGARKAAGRLTLTSEDAPYRGILLPQPPERDRGDVLRAHLADQRLDEPRVTHPEIPGSGAGRAKRGGGGIASQLGAGGGGVALRVGEGQRGGEIGRAHV